MDPLMDSIYGKSTERTFVTRYIDDVYIYESYFGTCDEQGV